MPSGMMLMGATQMTILTGWDHSHLSPAEGLFSASVMIALSRSKCARGRLQMPYRLRALPALRP
jgi:hypothetical protein